MSGDVSLVLRLPVTRGTARNVIDRCNELLSVAWANGEQSDVFALQGKIAKARDVLTGPIAFGEISPLVSTRLRLGQLFGRELGGQR